MNTIFLFGLFILSPMLVNGGKLLFVDFVPFASYTNLVTGIVNTLASHHHITLLSIVHDAFDHPNVTLFKLHHPNLHIMSQRDIFKQIESKKKFFLIQKTLISITKEFIDDTFKINPILVDIITNQYKYDLFFSFSHLSEHLLPLANVVQAPVVQLSPSEPLPWQSDSVGNPVFLGTAHTLISDEDPDYLYGRFSNFMKHLSINLMYYCYYIPYINKHAMLYYPPKTPSLQEILSNSSLLIVNTVEAMGFSRPAESNTINVGGLHCRPPKKLPKEIKEFIENPPNKNNNNTGFIYISFGTTISANFPQKFTNILIKVLSKLPYKILWKTNQDITNLPSNIKVSKWFPQQDILGHPKIKLFITHGGMLSLQEAVYHAVPVFVIPITFDQPSNAFKIKKIGYGRYLLFPEVTEQTLALELQEVLSNTSYKNKINELSKLMRDEPISSANKLIWWTNYIIKNNGFPLYRSNNTKYSWMKMIEIDILLVFILIFILIVYLFKQFVSFVGIFMKCTNYKFKTH